MNNEFLLCILAEIDIKVGLDVHNITAVKGIAC